VRTNRGWISNRSQSRPVNNFTHVMARPIPAPTHEHVRVTYRRFVDDTQQLVGRTWQIGGNAVARELGHRRKFAEVERATGNARERTSELLSIRLAVADAIVQLRSFLMVNLLHGGILSVRVHVSALSVFRCCGAVRPRSVKNLASHARSPGALRDRQRVPQLHLVASGRGWRAAHYRSIPR
jgi:hypothetical protein